MVLLFCVSQNSLFKQVEEMEQDSLITLNVERLVGTYGRVTVEWIANGSISDVFPASGMVCISLILRKHWLYYLRKLVWTNRKEAVLVVLVRLPCSINFGFMVLACEVSSSHFCLPRNNSMIWLFRTRYCNSVQAIKMFICRTLFPFSVLPVVRYNNFAKSLHR